MRKFLIPLITSLLLTFPVFAQKVDLKTIESDLRKQESELIPAEFRCPKKGFKGFDAASGRYAFISNFMNPFKHIDHIYIGDNMTHLVYIVEVYFDVTNKNILNQCISEIGRLEPIKTPTEPPQEEQKSPEDKDGM